MSANTQQAHQSQSDEERGAHDGIHVYESCTSDDIEISESDFGAVENSQARIAMFLRSRTTESRNSTFPVSIVRFQREGERGLWCSLWWWGSSLEVLRATFSSHSQSSELMSWSTAWHHSQTWMASALSSTPKEMGRRTPPSAASSTGHSSPARAQTVDFRNNLAKELKRVPTYSWEECLVWLKPKVGVGTPGIENHLLLLHSERSSPPLEVCWPGRVIIPNAKRS